MGDTNRPTADKETEQTVQLPKSGLARESGQHPVAPESGVGVASPDGTDPKVAVVFEAIGGVSANTANQLGEQLATVIDVDFKRRRAKGSNVIPLKGLAKPKLRPKEVKKPRAKPPKVDGLTPLPTPMVQKIAGGVRTEVSTAVLERTADYAQRTGRERLMQMVGILDEKLLAREPGPVSAADAATAARDLLALGADEELVSQKRSTDNTYFNAVATILLNLWPRNWQNHVNDRRVTDMMRVIREGGPHARILGLIKNWM